MMHIGFLTPEYPHFLANTTAGIGSSIKNLAEALVRKEIKVSIFIYGQNINTVFLEDGIKFHFIKQQKFLLGGWFLYRKFIQNYLNKYVAVDGIQVIEAPDWTGITAFMRLRCPLIIRMHGTDAYFCKLEGRPQKTKNFLLEKFGLLGANKLLSVSEFTAKETMNIFGLKGEVKVIPNSVNTDLLTSENSGVTAGRILYFGTVIRKKGVLELPQIFNRVIERKVEVELLIVGKDVIDSQTGRSTKEMMKERFTSDAARKVKWIGELSHEKVLLEIAAAQVIVLPSFAEAFPMTWLEAMAMEKALVTSNIGWADEIMIDEQTGYTENPKNHENFSEKILKLLNDQIKAQAMGRAARKRILENFSTDIIPARNVNFYKEVIEDKCT
ncbi:glycosyltransferase family 4 protein [Salinimicrobium sp. TH3]|uniref:glycosyltransferase family 4 protein n=1 Tax=Salinimicrobium sp. TH3 TaxID=2997342 RepID=UPI00227647CD|nr:glycosyltransferase family 4 protein [Salinimicrobium sp. TH3]MCY2687869.1 glycosyltransferase family 4 protein [Salinimicrobium sp. TH3]